ncbi:MAG: alpha/beta fold hydrolase [Thermodesulfobacteriota bacterium]
MSGKKPKGIKSGLRKVARRVIRAPGAVVRKMSVLIPLPDDLEKVTSYTPSEEADPAEAGMSARSVSAIWSAVTDLYCTGMHPALSFCLRRRGRVVLKRAIGHARGNGPRDHAGAVKTPATPDTPVCLFSASNAMLAMLVHVLSERGALRLMDPISHYIPEFAQNGKEDLTLLSLLTHRSGVPALPAGLPPDTLFDHHKMLDMVCRAAPFHPGGQGTAYRFLTGGVVLAEIIRRVTGMNLRTLVADLLAKPLGLRYFNYGLAREDQEEAALNYRTGPPAAYPFSWYAERALRIEWDKLVAMSNEQRFLDAQLGSVNFYATADEVSRFFQCLLNQGELGGVRVFEPLTVRRATMEATPKEFDRTLLFPMRYTPGFMMGGSPLGLFGSFTQHAYGYWGFSASFLWADPGREISVALLSTGKPLAGVLSPAFFRLMSLISWYCRGKGHETVSMKKPHRVPAETPEKKGRKQQRLTYNPDRVSEFSEKVLLTLVHESERLMKRSAYQRSNKTPADVIYQDDILSVLHYKPLRESYIKVMDRSVPVEGLRYKTPLVFIPPLMAPGFAFDLYPERSLARYFLARGFDVYMLDFGRPERRHAAITFEHYILTWMRDGLEAVRKDAGRKRLSLWGYCMGGLFCFLYTSVLEDRNIKNIVSVASPVDAHQMGAAGKVLSVIGLPAHKLAKLFGMSVKDLDPRIMHVPGKLGTIGFNLTNPLGVLKSHFDLLVNLWDRDYLIGHDSLENWIGNLLDYPGRTMQEIVVQMFLANRLGRKGSMKIGPHEASLADIRCPVLAFAGNNDKIVPYASAHKVMDMIGSQEKDFLVVPGGHVGVIIGSPAPEHLWKKSADWLAERS